MATTDIKDLVETEKFSVHIHSLPETVMLDIFSHLIFSDLCNCAGVCQRWYNLAKDFSLQRKIILNKPISKAKCLSLIMNHFTENLLDFEMLVPFQYDDRGRRQDMWNVHDLIDNCYPHEPVFCSIDADILWNICTRCTNMKKMVFMCCFLLMVNLNHFPFSVQHISLRRCRIRPESFFGQGLICYLPNLVCLDLCGVNNYMTSQDMYRLNSLKTLRALFLQDCYRINTGGIESITELLPQLEILDIEGTEVEDKGILEIIKYCENIRHLYIGNLYLADLAILALTRGQMPQLRNLCIKNITPLLISWRSFPKLERRQEKLVIGHNCMEDESNQEFQFQDNNIFLQRIESPEKCSCHHYYTHKNFGVK